MVCCDMPDIGVGDRQVLKIDKDELIWEELLDSLQNQTLIPILGPDLCKFETDGQLTSLDHYLASMIPLARLGLRDFDYEQLPANFGLNDMVVAFLQAGTNIDQLSIIYRKVSSIIKQLVREPSFTAPMPLRQLAAITDFQLYVSLTFDPFIDQALDQERPEGMGDWIAYSPHISPAEWNRRIRELNKPCVFRLFGDCRLPNCFAATDDDMIEYIHRLHDHESRPKDLFDDLAEKDLLIVGCGFADWIARFFIRILQRNESGLTERTRYRFIADDMIPKDPRRVVYLQRFHARHFICLDTDRFVDELYERWKQRRREHEPNVRPGMSEDTPTDYVFISYYHRNLEYAQALREALEDLRIPVWMDTLRLGGGAEYDQRIGDAIERATLFVPLLTSETVAAEGYYRKEWAMAIDKYKQTNENYPFIAPVSFEDVSYESPDIRLELRSLTWLRKNQNEDWGRIAREIQCCYRSRKRQTLLRTV